MDKDAYYFPHFANAKSDRKILRVRKELGLEGYGIFFMLLETLRDQADLRYPMEDVDLLADEFGTSEQKVMAVIGNYGLFEIDEEERFFSPKLIIYLQPYFTMKEQRRIAGIESGRKRKESRELNDRSTTVQRMMNENEQSKVKESKVKKSKEEYIYAPSDEGAGQQPQQQSAEYHEHYEQESELHEQPTPKPVKTQRFSKPTLEEVSAYCQERSNRIDAQQFVDYYEANGWKVGRNSMKDWRAAVRTWERHETTVTTTRASPNVLSFEERAKKQREQNTAEVLKMIEEGTL